MDVGYLVWRDGSAVTVGQLREFLLGRPVLGVGAALGKHFTIPPMGPLDLEAASKSLADLVDECCDFGCLGLDGDGGGSSLG